MALEIYIYGCAGGFVIGGLCLMYSIGYIKRFLRKHRTHPVLSLVCWAISVFYTIIYGSTFDTIC